MSGSARHGTAQHGVERDGAAAPASSDCGAAASGLAALWIFLFFVAYIDVYIYIHGGGVCCLRRSG